MWWGGLKQTHDVVFAGLSLYRFRKLSTLFC